jgi:hypothetical protein
MKILIMRTSSASCHYLPLNVFIKNIISYISSFLTRQENWKSIVNDLAVTVDQKILKNCLTVH